DAVPPGDGDTEVPADVEQEGVRIAVNQATHRGAAVVKRPRRAGDEDRLVTDADQAHALAAQLHVDPGDVGAVGGGRPAQVPPEPVAAAVFGDRVGGVADQPGITPVRFEHQPELAPAHAVLSATRARTAQPGQCQPARIASGVVAYENGELP